MATVNRMDFTGGRADSLGIGLLKPNQLIDSKNAVHSSLYGYPSGANSSKITGTVGSISSRPHIGKIFGANYVERDFLFSLVREISIATFETVDFPNETWTESHPTAEVRIVSSLTEGNKALQLIANNGPVDSVGTVPSKDISYLGTATMLVADCNVSGLGSSQEALHIRIGSSSSAYRTFTTGTTNWVNGNNVAKIAWSSGENTGTPDLTNITYVRVFWSSSQEVDVTLKIDNIRFASYSSETYGNTGITENSVNVWSAYFYTYDKTLPPKLVLNAEKNLYITDSGYSNYEGSEYYLTPFKSGFSLSHPGDNFCFAQFTQIEFSDVGVVEYVTDTSKNSLYFVNGVDGYWRYDVPSTAFPFGDFGGFYRLSSRDYKCICSHKNHMFLSGYSDNPNAIYISDLNDPCTVDDENSIVCPGTSDDNVVKCLLSVGDYLYVLRSQDICIIEGSGNSGADQWSIRKLDVSHGTINQNSAVQVGDKVFHYDGNGVFVCNGVYDELISASVSKLLVTPAYIGSAKPLLNIRWMSYNPLRGWVILFMPYTTFYCDPPVGTSLTSCKCLIFDISTTSWHEIGRDNSYISMMYGGINYSGSGSNLPSFVSFGTNVYEWDSYSYWATAPQEFMVKTAFDNNGSPNVIKNYNKVGVYIHGESSLSVPSTYITVYTDYDASTAKYGPEMFVPENGYKEIQLSPVYGKSISVKLQTYNPSSQVIFDGIGYTYEPQDGGWL